MVAKKQMARKKKASKISSMHTRPHYAVYEDIMIGIISPKNDNNHTFQKKTMDINIRERAETSKLYLHIKQWHTKEF